MVVILGMMRGAQDDVINAACSAEVGWLNECFLVFVSFSLCDLCDKSLRDKRMCHHHRMFGCRHWGNPSIYPVLRMLGCSSVDILSSALRCSLLHPLLWPMNIPRLLGECISPGWMDSMRCSGNGLKTSRASWRSLSRFRRQILRNAALNCVG